MKKGIEVGRRIASFIMKENDDARIMTNAATITLFLFISLFPLLMILMTLIPLFPITLSDVLQLLASVVPGELFPLVQMIAEELYQKSMDGSALSVTIVLALWAASSGVSWLVRGVNDVYRSRERRNWVKLRLMSLFYTVILIAVILVTLLCFVFGHNVQTYLIDLFPSLAVWEQQLVWIRNLFALAVVDIFVTLIYQVFPRNRTFFLRQFPGAVFATAGWYIFSAVYSFYLKTISNYSYTYGSLAAIVSMIIWLFVCMNIVLIGGEINYLWNRRRQARKEACDRSKTDEP